MASVLSGIYMLHVGSCYKNNVFRTTLIGSAFLKWPLMHDGQLWLEVYQIDVGHL